MYKYFPSELYLRNNNNKMTTTRLWQRLHPLLLAVLLVGGIDGFQTQRQASVQGASVGAEASQLSAASVVVALKEQPVKTLALDCSLKATLRGSASSETIRDDVSLAPLDTGAIGRYFVALAVQMGLLTGFLTAIDMTVSSLGLAGKIPFAVNFFFFYVLALKSRVFNPMSNERPKPATKELDTQDTVAPTPEARKMPSWTPPGVVFPIVWLLIVGPLRAIASSMVVSKLLAVGGGSVAATARYGSTQVLSLMLHLSIGDIWNTINNSERRYGTSVLGVCFVWISAAVAASQYYQIVPLAGKLLSLPLVWLTIASSLIFRTWQLNNPNPITGCPYSILPRLEQEAPIGEQTKTITKLIWVEK